MIPPEVLNQVSLFARAIRSREIRHLIAGEEAVASTGVLEVCLGMEGIAGCTRKRSRITQISKASAVFLARVFARKGIFRANLSSTRDKVYYAVYIQIDG